MTRDRGGERSQPGSRGRGPSNASGRAGSAGGSAGQGNRDDRGRSNQDRARSSQERGRSSREFGRSDQDRGRSGQERGVSNQDRGRAGQERGVSSQDRARSNQDRGRSNQERGYFNQERGYSDRDRSSSRRRPDEEEVPELARDGESEFVFGKNAVMAFLEGIARESSSDSDKWEHDDVDDEPVHDDSAKPADRANEASDASRGDSAESEQGKTEMIRGQRKSASINKIYMVPSPHQDRRVDRIKALAKAQRIPVVVADKRKVDNLVGADQLHQGIVASLSPAEFWDLDEFLDVLKEHHQGVIPDGAVIAVLDGIEDPHNLGAIVRVAEAAGVKALVLQSRRSAGLTGIVAKTSAGALASLPIVRVHNLSYAIEKLKESGFWVAGLDVHEGQLYFESDLMRPLAFIVGSEGKGMSRLVKENCDLLLQIPMLGETESLNASVAAGVVFYEVVRQVASRSSKKPIVKDGLIF